MLASTGVKNRASEIGPSKFPWWLDWRGECVALIASGPSAKKTNIKALRDRIHVAVIKETIELCPFAEVVYGCDWPWWRKRLGLPKFNGLKLAYTGNETCAHYPDIKKINIKNPKTDQILTDEPGWVGSGGNSGFQLLNIVAQFGVTGVILIGFDMHGRDGAHWYGRNNGMGMSNPMETNFERWRKAFAGVADDLNHRGIDVVNASPSSALNCFRRATIDESLAGWGL